MNKKIIITCCDICPNRTWSHAEMYIHLGYETPFFCRTACKPLEHTNAIPAFCPLLDDADLAQNLCNSCTNEFAIYKSNPEFGIGVGNENVCDCDAYIHKALMREYKRIADEQAEACKLLDIQIENLSETRQILAEPYQHKLAELEANIRLPMLDYQHTFISSFGKINFRKGAVRRTWNLDALDQICEARKDNMIWGEKRYPAAFLFEDVVYLIAPRIESE